MDQIVIISAHCDPGPNERLRAYMLRGGGECGRTALPFAAWIVEGESGNFAMNLSGLERNPRRYQEIA